MSTDHRQDEPYAEALKEYFQQHFPDITIDNSSWWHREFYDITFEHIYDRLTYDERRHFTSRKMTLTVRIIKNTSAIIASQISGLEHKPFYQNPTYPLNDPQSLPKIIDHIKAVIEKCKQ